MNENQQGPVQRRSLRGADEASATPTRTRPKSRRYPRTGKGPVLRWLPGWKLVLGVILGAIALGAQSAGNIQLPAGSTLPPLPEIGIPGVCNLPQEAIDFLKDNGSMEQDDCEPEQQPTR